VRPRNDVSRRAAGGGACEHQRKGSEHKERGGSQICHPGGEQQAAQSCPQGSVAQGSLREAGLLYHQASCGVLLPHRAPAPDPHARLHAPTAPTRRPWSADEDAALRAHHQLHGSKWSAIAQKMPGRSSKQVRERYMDHLRPDIDTSPWTAEEDHKIVSMHQVGDSLPGPLPLVALPGMLALPVGLPHTVCRACVRACVRARMRPGRMTQSQSSGRRWPRPSKGALLVPSKIASTQL